jgi:CHAD domain-containing protein
LPGRLLDRPAPEGVRWLALARLQDLIDARHRLDDPDDAKALHDFRVALRRFRSLLRTYRDVLDDSVTRKSRSRLRRLASAAGLSRDSEVRLKWMRQHVKNSAATAGGVEWVEAELDRDRIKGDRQLQRALDRNFAPLVDRLQRTLHQFRTTTTLGEVAVVSPMRDVTAQALHTLATAVEGAFAQAHAAGNPELMHRSRIAAKRLRYTLEPLVDAKLVPARTRQTAGAAIAQLKRMQDAFGELHDELAFDQWLAERELGDLALASARAAVVAKVRRQLHRKAGGNYRTLDGPLWRHRIDRIIRRAHTVADHLTPKLSDPPGAPAATELPSPDASRAVPAGRP